MSGSSSKNGNEETPAVFLGLHHSGAHKLTDQGHTPQTGHVRETTKVGVGIERVGHRVLVHNCYQGAGDGWLHCGEVRSVKARYR